MQSGSSQVYQLKKKRITKIKQTNTTHKAVAEKSNIPRQATFSRCLRTQLNWVEGPDRWLHNSHMQRQRESTWVFSDINVLQYYLCVQILNTICPVIPKYADGQINERTYETQSYALSKAI